MTRKKNAHSIEQNVKHEYTFNWKIEKFSVDFDTVESELLNLHPMCCSTWKIVLSVLPDNTLLNVALHRLDKGFHSVNIVCDLSFRNSRQTPYVKRSISGIFSVGNESKSCAKPFYRPNIIKSVKNDVGSQFKLCKDDAFLVEGKITTTSCCSYNESTDRSLSELRHAFFELYNEKLFTDVDFVVGNDIIPAHKALLAARSSVFRKMLETEMKENAENRIVITDIEKPILEAFLFYIYSGAVKISDVNSVSQLYTLADKYDVKSLKEDCQKLLSSNISEENACDVLILADLHNDDDLRKIAQDFIVTNFISMQTNDQWKNLLQNNTSLAATVVSAVVLNIKIK